MSIGHAAVGIIGCTWFELRGRRATLVPRFRSNSFTLRLSIGSATTFPCGCTANRLIGESVRITCSGFLLFRKSHTLQARSAPALTSFSELLPTKLTEETILKNSIGIQDSGLVSLDIRYGTDERGNDLEWRLSLIGCFIDQWDLFIISIQ